MGYKREEKSAIVTYVSDHFTISQNGVNGVNGDDGDGGGLINDTRLVNDGGGRGGEEGGRGRGEGGGNLTNTSIHTEKVGHLHMIKVRSEILSFICLYY